MHNSCKHTTRTDKSWNDSDSIRGEGAHILQGAQIGAGGAEPLWPPHFNHYISLRGLRGRCKLPQQGPVTRTGLIILTRHKNRSTFGRCHGRLTCFLFLLLFFLTHSQSRGRLKLWRHKLLTLTQSESASGEYSWTWIWMYFSHDISGKN